MRDNTDYRAANGRAQASTSDSFPDLRRAENLSPAMGTLPSAVKAASAGPVVAVPRD